MYNKANISTQLKKVFQSLPHTIQQRARTEQFIKKMHRQFQEVMDDELLPYINAVYLLDDKQALSQTVNTALPSPATHPKKLIVYVENSICATEINAKRELYVLKYRELFQIPITLFEIRISKTAYKNKHPFIQEKTNSSTKSQPLTVSEYHHIDEMVAEIENPVLQESFKKVLIAQKQQNKS